MAGRFKLLKPAPLVAMMTPEEAGVRGAVIYSRWGPYLNPTYAKRLDLRKCIV